MEKESPQLISYRNIKIRYSSAFSLSFQVAAAGTACAAQNSMLSARLLRRNMSGRGSQCFISSRSTVLLLYVFQCRCQTQNKTFAPNLCSFFLCQTPLLLLLHIRICARIRSRRQCFAIDVFFLNFSLFSFFTLSLNVFPISESDEFIRRSS